MKGKKKYQENSAKIKNFRMYSDFSSIYSEKKKMKKKNLIRVFVIRDTVL